MVLSGAKARSLDQVQAASVPLGCPWGASVTSPIGSPTSDRGKALGLCTDNTPGEPWAHTCYPEDKTVVAVLKHESQKAQIAPSLSLCPSHWQPRPVSSQQWAHLVVMKIHRRCVTHLHVTKPLMSICSMPSPGKALLIAELKDKAPAFHYPTWWAPNSGLGANTEHRFQTHSEISVLISERSWANGYVSHTRCGEQGKDDALL